MDQEIAVIAQNPFAVGIAFYRNGELTALFHLKLDLITDGLILAGVGTAANDEVVGETCYISEVEDNDVVSFLRFSGLYRREPVRLSLWG